MLRKYQSDVIKKVNDFMKKDKDKELIIKLYTGLGKTYLMPRIAKEILDKYNVLISSDILQLINQLEEHFKNMSLNISRIVSDNDSIILGSITLASEQTLYNRLERIKFKHNKDLVILYDEAHKRRNGERFISIINKLKPVKLIGFTATPFDQKGNLISNNIYEPIKYTDAEELGYIARAKYVIPHFIKKMNFEDLKVSGFDYSQESIRKLYKEQFFKDEFKNFFKSLDNRQTLIFCSNIDMANDIAKLLNVNVFHSKNHHENLVNDFKNGKIKVLVGVTSLTTGFDAPNIERIIDLRPTKIKSLFYQMIGRGSRITKNKKEFEYICLSNNLFVHGIPEIDNGKDSKMISAIFKTIKDNNYAFSYKDINKNLSFYEKQISLASATIEQLKILFEYTDDVRMIVNIINEVNRRKKGYYLRGSIIEKIIYEMNFYLEKLEKFNKKKSTIKAYKTRLRNIVNSGSRIENFKSFPKWFYEQTIKKYKF